MVGDATKAITKEQIMRNLASQSLLNEIGVDVTKCLQRDEPKPKQAIGAFFDVGEDEDNEQLAPKPSSIPGLPNPFAMPSLRDFKQPKIEEKHNSTDQIHMKMDGLEDKKKELSDSDKEAF